VQNKEKLQHIIDDPATSASERQEAQREIDAQYAEPESALIPLEAELLYEYHAATLADVQYHDIAEFCAAHKQSADADALYMKWLGVSPVARKKMRQMRKHLENYFLECYDSLLTRYKSGLDTGGDMNALDKEALAFYRTWIDSSIVPEEMRPHFQQLIAAFSARTEGHHDTQNR
jgi:hypothetical protein